MIKKHKQYFFLFFAVVIVFFLMPANIVFADSEEVGGATLYTYTSQCPASVNFTSSRGIIYAKGATQIDKLYLFFAGMDNQSPKEACVDGAKNYNLCALAARAKEKGNNLAILFSQADNKGTASQNLTKDEINCLLNEGKQQVKNAGLSFSGDVSVVAGHSGGGNFVRSYLQNGFSVSTAMVFDGCYGDWCSQIAKSGKAGSIFLYYNKNDPAISAGAQKAQGGNVTALGLDADHYQIPKICFLDHLTGDKCVGGAAPAPAESAKPAPAVQTVSEIQKLMAKPVTKIRIPGLNFSDPKVVEEGGQKYIYIPFLGEYIAALYKWFIAALGIFTVVRFLQAGFGWLIAGGVAEKVNVEKKKIQNAVAGLLLAVSSYILLYTINPNLVQFKSLKVQYVETVPLELPDIAAEPVQMSGVKLTSAANIPAGIVPCDNPTAYGLIKIPPMTGIKYLKNDNQNYLLPEVVESLKKVGEFASAQSYTIGISTACRSTVSQMQLADKNPKGLSMGTVSKPGNSPHGFGYAVDVHLIKNGKDLTAKTVGQASNGGQCSMPAKDPEVLDAIKKQSEFFFKAGWVRLTTESWHYEYGTAGKFCRAQCYGFASLCNQNGAEDCPKNANGCKS